MSDRSSRRGRASVLLVVACVLVAGVAPATVAGSPGDRGESLDRRTVDESPVPDASSIPEASLSRDGSFARNASPGPTASRTREAVGPDLRSASGTVELVVRFAGEPGLSASDADGGGRLSTDDLRTTAATAQGGFERFAERKPGVTVERRFWLANAMLVTVDTESVAVERLLDVRGVERVHRNFRVRLGSAASGGDGAAVGGTGSVSGSAGAARSASSTSTNATDGVDMVRAPAVWDEFDTRGAGATVAVLDTGIDPDHPDLTVSGWAAFDAEGSLVSRGPENAVDHDGHGTHVAGTVAGGDASGTAIGVAPEAELYGVKVLNDTGAGTFAQVVAGMEHATDDPTVDVLQVSLGANGQFDGFIEPVQNARSAGKVVVVSAGNGGSGTSSSPGNVYESFAVGAVDENRDVASFSGGETLDTSEDWSNETLTADWPAEYVAPDASAPGVSVYSAQPGGAYARRSGTSMAAPHVSGVAALMIAASTRSVTDEEIHDTIGNTANHPADATDPDTRYGAGIVDGYAAVSSITENRSTLSVTAFDAPAETAPGATLETTATVNNTGADPGTGTVEYRFGDAVGDEATVSLAPGENVTVSFSHVVPSDTQTDATYEHGAYVDDSNRTAAVDVVEPPLYEVTDLTAPAIVERNETLDATANVTNVGGLAGGNRTVELRLTDPGDASDVRGLDAATVSLGAGSAATVALNGTVPDDVATGETTVTVATPADAADATVRVADAVGTVNGTVTDAETDATLPGIAVVAEAGDETVGETTTGPNGTYAVSVPASALDVTASNASYAPSTGRATLNGSGDAATADLSLALRNGTLSGVVGASDGLEPPSNATVTVRGETAATVATVDAASDGSYETALRPGTYELTAAAPAFDETDASKATGVTVDPDATTGRDLALAPRPATLSGTVTAADGGDPIANATVTVGSGPNAPTATTEADGGYSLAAARGERRATASADGYVDATRPVGLASNGSAAVDFALATPPEFLVDGLSGPAAIERGESGDFDAEIRNAGGVTGDATVRFAVAKSGISTSETVSIAPGETRTVTFAGSVDADAPTGGHDATAATRDDSATVSFEVAETGGDAGGTTGSPAAGGGGGSDGDGRGDGGGGGSAGGGDDGATVPDGDGETAGPADEPTEPADETKVPTATANETTAPANGTTVPTNVTTDPPDETDAPANRTDEPIDSRDSDGDGPNADGADGSDGDDGNADNEGTADGGPNVSDNDTSDEAPGFGPTLGVVALLAAALLTRLRDGDG